MIDCILHGDSFDLVKDIPDHSIDLILEDMPYNSTNCEWDVKIDLELYWETRLRILKPTGVVILTASQPFTTDVIVSNRGMFKYELIWNKNMPTGAFNANKRPLKGHENILVFYDRQPVYNPIKTKRSEDELKRFMIKPIVTKIKNSVYGEFERTVLGRDAIYKMPDSKLFFDVVNGRNGDKEEHPTQKPVGLFEYLIRTYTNEGDLVFDGFGGSGTTAIAASKCNRHFIVIEKEKKYFDASQKRLTEFRSQLKLAI